jgi:hypothetical protein
MNAKILEFPYDRVNTDVLVCEASILKMPERRRLDENYFWAMPLVFWMDVFGSPDAG